MVIIDYDEKGESACEVLNRVSHAHTRAHVYKIDANIYHVHLELDTNTSKYIPRGWEFCKRNCTHRCR